MLGIFKKTFKGLEKTRKKVLNMNNNELGSMPDDMLDAFVASPEFELYKSMGEMYGA